MYRLTLLFVCSLIIFFAFPCVAQEADRFPQGQIVLRHDLEMPLADQLVLDCSFRGFYTTANTVALIALEGVKVPITNTSSGYAYVGQFANPLGVSFLGGLRYDQSFLENWFLSVDTFFSIGGTVQPFITDFTLFYRITDKISAGFLAESSMFYDKTAASIFVGPAMKFEKSIIWLGGEFNTKDYGARFTARWVHFL